MSPSRLKNYAALCCGWCVAMAAQVGRTEPAVSQKFNGPDAAWKLLGTGIPAQILAQECLPGGARDNSGFERVVVAAPAGQSALLVCPIPRVAVLDELQIRLWVKADRPDVQVAARVALPRSLDSQRRTPATAIVRGSLYNRPGHWQELGIAGVPKLLADQIRVMRATPGAAIDSHEAFVDAVVLIVPGNPTGMEVGTDDLEVEGVLLSPTNAVQPAAKPVTATRSTAQAMAQHSATIGKQAAVTTRDAGPAAANASSILLQGSTLFVDGKLFLPRVIQWNGESLQFLSSCGFNVIQLPTQPSVEQSADAERYGLWFMCSPEHPDALARAGLGRTGDRVLAWHLQDDALEVDSNYAMRWAELVREQDAVFGRPVVITPQSNWAATKKAADILIARHPRIGLLSLSEFQSWLEVCPQKAQPGTPLWICLSTQSDEAIRRQVSALTHVAAPSLCVDAQQLESSVQIACAHGARGFVFQSASSLSETDEPTRQRAATLQLINRRLQLMEPWLAGGKVVERVASADGVQSGVLLHVDRARLLIRLPNESGTQVRVASEPARSSSKDIVFIVPGVPETSQVFYLSPVAMRTLSSQRIAGGTKIALPGGGDGFVLMTEDPQVIQSLRQRIARDGPKTVQLERDLAVQLARTLASGGQKLTQLGYNSDLAAREAASVNQQLAQLDSLLASGQVEQSHEVAAVVRQQLERAAGEQRRAVAAPAGLESNPLAASTDTLPEFAALQRSLESMRPGENLLVGGDFEDLGQMRQLGWQHVASPESNVQTAAQLSVVEPQHGKYCLELNATAESTNERHAIASNLVWIVSPPILVSQNQAVEISGWVRVEKPFASGEGLEIVDSLGGPALSLVVGHTSGWQPFRLIRAASEPAQLRITFSLAGLGSVKVDAVMVRTLDQPIARRLPPAQPAGRSTATNTVGTPGPRFAAPPTR